ncbi:MAG: hypothetical protein ACOYON_05900 [Fimbriimonas sp.]
MIATAIAMLVAIHSPLQAQVGSKPIRQVALLPWALKDGTETADKTARDMVRTLLEKSNYEVLPEVRTKTAWEEGLKLSPIKGELEGKDALPELPGAKDLLALGKLMGVDLVCAGRAVWHTKSVWVGLGPKTKADCTVDVLIVDVKKEEVVLDAKGIKSDSTKKEKGLETAGALLLSFGITGLSGGPKTPHQQRAAQNAISLAMEPWLRTAAAQSRKIGGG